MDIKVWITLDAILTLVGIGVILLMAPTTLWAFIPEQSDLPALWFGVGMMSIGFGLAYELYLYVRKYGF